MTLRLDPKTCRWLVAIGILARHEVTPIEHDFFIKEGIDNEFENGVRIGLIAAELCRRKMIPVPGTLSHLKTASHTAAQLYNWNIINDTLRRIDYEIDSETKNLIINGDHRQLARVLMELRSLGEKQSTPMEDSLDDSQPQRKQGEDSLSLSKSEGLKHSPQSYAAAKKTATNSTPQTSIVTTEGHDLLEYVIKDLMSFLKLNRKQAAALLSDNNKYLAHVLVKGIKGDFTDIETLFEKWFKDINYIVERITNQNDMCFFFLQAVKPALLSKSEEVAQWSARILAKIANELAAQEMLPLAYDWFVRESGGLHTTILALQRHPQLIDHMLPFILEFGKYNVAELFTVQLRKVTFNDSLAYFRFVAILFGPLVKVKTSADELLSGGVIDYWVETALKCSESDPNNSLQLRLTCMDFILQLWREYPSHLEESLNQVNPIMTNIKKGIRQGTLLVKIRLLQLLSELLDDFARRKNPYASIVYKKITFLFIQNHQDHEVREFILENMIYIFAKYQSIPVDIFLEPYSKQIKISESKTYQLNISDLRFMNVIAQHRKLRSSTGLELYDLLAKIRLSSFVFGKAVESIINLLLDRFLMEDFFFEYTVKLVKICLATIFNALKAKQSDPVAKEKRTQIVHFILSFLPRGNGLLNEEIKTLTLHVKAQLTVKLKSSYRGVQKILDQFGDTEFEYREVIEALSDADKSMQATQSKESFHLPRIDAKYRSKDSDETASQMSFKSSNTKYSHQSRQDFPLKDYTQFAEEDEKKFLKSNSDATKKKPMLRAQRTASIEKDTYDPKVMDQILRIKEKKEEEKQKKEKEREQLNRKKEQLKVKIQRELEQRLVKQGRKGSEHDAPTQVVFDENQIDEKILEDDHEWFRNLELNSQEQRDQESIRVVIRRYTPFLRKIFNKYTSARLSKKDYFQAETDQLSQIDLLRLCKQKNLEKAKQPVVDMMKQTNNRNIQAITFENFLRFLELLCIGSFLKERCSTRMPMGDHLKGLLKRIATGENIRLQDDDDEICRSLTEKVRYNPHIELPQSYKKIYERNYTKRTQIGFHVCRAVKEKFVVCLELLNDLIEKALGFPIIEPEIQFLEEARVVSKKQFLPPRPSKKQQPVSLLEEKEQPKPIASREEPRKRSVGKSVPVGPRPPNIVEKKRIEEEDQMRSKREHEEELRKVRHQEVKRLLKQQEQERRKQKQEKEGAQKRQREEEEERQRLDKETKEKYLQKQKEKLSQYRKEQQEKEQEEKARQAELRKKEDEQKKSRNRQRAKKEDDKKGDEQGQPAGKPPKAEE